MTRDDANEMVSTLVARGRRQTEELLKELERALDSARGQVGTRSRSARKSVEKRTTKARKGVEKRTTKARRSAERAGGRVAKSVRDAADQPLQEVDKVRRRAGVGSFPITGYDELTATQVASRLDDLKKPELRKVRTYEKNNKARKSILDKIETRLG
jgi:hypothetical protein